MNEGTFISLSKQFLMGKVEVRLFVNKYLDTKCRSGDPLEDLYYQI
jgi:hypothetical protein